MTEEHWEYCKRTKGWSDEERIREIANKLWLEENKPQGKDLDIWIAAERAFGTYYPWNPYVPHTFNWRL